MQINLKPSALKNEVNAALHFVKFLKRTRNLAVTDAPFNATLENVKDMLETFRVSRRIAYHYDICNQYHTTENNSCKQY